MTSSSESEWFENCTFDEISIGQTASLLRTLTLADIQKFASVCTDSGAEGQFESASNGAVAHGIWSGALISTLLGTQFPGSGTVCQSQDLSFVKPVCVGDTVAARVTVSAIDQSSKTVVLDCLMTNQRGETVVDGRVRVLPPKTKFKFQRSAPQAPDIPTRLQRLLALAHGLEPVRCAVVHPCDQVSLRGAMDASRYGLIVPVLIGHETRIRTIAEQSKIDITSAEIVSQNHSHAAAEVASQMAVDGKVEMLMKGSLHTDELLIAVLKKTELRTGRRMSHVFRFDVPRYSKPLLITDAALNIRPGLAEKMDIVQNAINFARVMGVAVPKVALLAAVETVNPNMPSTLDAAALCKMADRGQITGGVLDGPLAFDNAISQEAARIKGIESKVSGDADILVVPDLDSGNMLAKQLEYLAGASGSGIVLGAKVPIALTSRAEGADNRVASAVLALMVAHNARRDRARVVW